MRQDSSRRRRSALASPVFAALLVLVVATGLWQKTSAWAASDHSHRQYYEELAKAPPKDRDRSNPLEGDPTAGIAGQKLFQQYCSECHGRSAEGGRKGPSLRVQEIRSATPGELFWVLTNGVARRGMPVWSKLPELQRWQVVSYLKTLN